MAELENIIEKSLAFGGIGYSIGFTLYSLGMGFYEGVSNQGFMTQGNKVPLDQELEPYLIAGTIPASWATMFGVYNQKEDFPVISNHFGLLILSPVCPVIAHAVGYGLGKLSELMSWN